MGHSVQIKNYSFEQEEAGSGCSRRKGGNSAVTWEYLCLKNRGICVNMDTFMSVIHQSCIMHT